METHNHLIDGRDRGYLDAALYARLANLTRVAVKTVTSLWPSKQRQASTQSPQRSPRHRR